MPDAPTPWWGTTRIPMDTTRRWRVGPLHLCVARRPYEWQMWWWREADDDATPVVVAQSAPDAPAPTEARSLRSAFGRTVEPLHLSPALPDRPLVVTPSSPFQILPGEQVVAYVTVPLWVRASVGARPIDIGEVPVQRPPDTWFGRDTMDGELCYAGRVRMRLAANALALPVQRAVTPVRMINEGADPLLIERVRLPMPQLPLFAAADGQLWTPEISLLRQETVLARVRIGDAPPEAATRAVPAAPARAAAPDPGLMVAFAALIGGLGGT